MQCYCSGPPGEVAAMAPRVKRCATDVSDWCSAKRLQFTAEKSELLGPGFVSSLQTNLAITVNRNVIKPSPVVVRDLHVFEFLFQCTPLLLTRFAIVEERIVSVERRDIIRVDHQVTRVWPHPQQQTLHCTHIQEIVYIRYTASYQNRGEQMNHAKNSQQILLLGRIQPH